MAGQDFLQHAAHGKCLRIKCHEFSRALADGIRKRHGRKQRLCIRMLRRGKEFLGGRFLDQLSPEQNANAVTQIAHH